jgi:membrane-bound metal-dependent hydrolase YbcI (DUF457 family)
VPSPIGHGLAGIAIACSAEYLPRQLRWALVPSWLLLTCALLATLPDIDILLLSIHRGKTHSIGAVALVAIISAAVTRWVTGRINWSVVFLCSLAWASHIFLDWLGQDDRAPRGIQAWWPFSDQWTISGWDIFRPTERRDPLSRATITHNALTAAREIVILGPIAGLLWLRRKKPSSVQ